MEPKVDGLPMMWFDVQDPNLAGFVGLSDVQAEFQIRDRLSFLRFLGLSPPDRTPDATTIWLFRAQRTQANAVEKLFKLFDRWSRWL